MKVLHITASFNLIIGGPAEVIRNIILECQRLSIDSEVVCLDDPAVLASNNELVLFNIHALGAAGRFWSYHPTLSTWLRQNLERFDVVIIHGLWLYPSYAATEAFRRVKSDQISANLKPVKVPRVFIFPHGMLDPYFQQASGRRLKAIRNWLYWKLIEHKVVNRADALFFTCETELLLARETFRPYRPKREINMGLGIIDPPPFSADMQTAFLDKCPQVKGQSYLLFLSRINPKKGLDLLLKAYASIVEANPDVEKPLPKLVVAGPGLDTPYGESIRQLVLTNASLRANVYFPGMLSGDAKWGALYGCDAFSLPSHQENFGIAVAEALACAKPVLVSNQVNIWREIERYGGGLIAEDSVAGTRSSLEKWVTLSAPDKQAMGQKARATFDQCFQMRQVALRLNEVFNSI